MKNIYVYMLKEIEKLRNEIEKHNRLYYDKNDPEISDYEYDILCQKLKNLLSKNDSTELFDNMQVGFTPNSKFNKIKHTTPMISLDNAFTENEVIKFDEKVSNFLNVENNTICYTAELKIDGLSFSAKYINGKLLYIATRGDGETGEDVSHAAPFIENFPLIIDYDRELEVRGEIYISKDDFEAINIIQSKNGGKIFANPRNAASGTLRNLDIDVIKNRRLKYFAYSAISEDLASSHYDCLNILNNMSFIVNKSSIKVGNIMKCIEFYNNLKDKRHEIEYDIDGIVYKVDNLHLQYRLGSTNRTPRWAIAHKFDGEIAVTKLNDIEYQVGRLGNITPVAILQPVNVGGVIIKRATLHNYDEIIRLNINTGDKVYVKRAGDVIPYISAVFEKISIGSAVYPNKCPSCNSTLIKDDEQVAIKCPNYSGCDEQIIQRIAHFTSKDALNIVGFAQKQIEKLYNLKIITKISDIFELENKEDILKSLDNMGDKSAQNLLSAIKNARVVNLDKFIYSLSIRHVGYGIANTIANYFITIESMIEKIINLDTLKDELMNIDGIGEKVVKEFISYFKDQSNLTEFYTLTKSLSISAIKSEIKDGIYSGKKIIFTGTLSKMSRGEAKETAARLGFDVVSSISKKLDFIVCGEKSGSKLKKANDFGIKVLLEDDWMQMISSQK